MQGPVPRPPQLTYSEFSNFPKLRIFIGQFTEATPSSPEAAVGSTWNSWNQIIALASQTVLGRGRKWFPPYQLFPHTQEKSSFLSA